jgi:hypothetical protein
MSSAGDAQRSLPNARRDQPGPRTVEGLARSRRANWKHGLYSAKAQSERRFLRQLLQDSGDLLKRF